MKRTLRFLSALLLLAIFFTGCAEKVDTPSETDTPEPSPTIEPTPVFTPVPLPTPVVFPTKGYCNGEGVNIWKTADTKGSIVDIMGENAVLDVRGLSGGWYEVNLGGETAYVAEQLLNLGEPPRKDNMCYGRVTALVTALYLSPSEEDISEKTLAEGDVVKILRAIGDYLHIVYDAPEDGIVQRFVPKADVLYIPIEEYLQARDAATATPTPEVGEDDPDEE